MSLHPESPSGTKLLRSDGKWERQSKYIKTNVRRYYSTKCPYCYIFHSKILRPRTIDMFNNYETANTPSILLATMMWRLMNEELPANSRTDASGFQTSLTLQLNCWMDAIHMMRLKLVHCPGYMYTLHVFCYAIWVFSGGIFTIKLMLYIVSNGYNGFARASTICG